MGVVSERGRIHECGAVMALEEGRFHGVVEWKDEKLEQKEL